LAFTPIFIVGVPRSGTTLLRVLLDSHSQIAALSETPWLLGAYGAEPSLREVLQGLMEGPYGVVRNVSGVQSQDVLAAGRCLIAEMFEPLLKKRNKQMLAFKTPDDIRHLDFLLSFMPHAYYIHITRDGRDVSMSLLAKKGTFFKDLKEYRRVSYGNVFRRWVEWEQRARKLLSQDGIRVIHLRYEDLIADPHRELRRITDFLGVPFELQMLDYAAKDHDYPKWEAGSTDVAGMGGLSPAPVGRWRQARMTPEILHTLMKYDDALADLGYERSRLAPGYLDRALASAVPLIQPILEAASRLRRLWLRPLSLLYFRLGKSHRSQGR
jgi:LPS sulfotransferase NodH